MRRSISGNRSWLLTIALVLAFSGVLSGQTSERIPATERKALVALFRSTDGDHWKNIGWLSPETLRLGEPGSECEWEGVECDDGHVLSLHLPESGLKGTLPSALANLTKLERLELAGNSLEGEIPEALFHLRQLEVLDLARNHLSGKIPLYKAVLPNVKRLDLSRNYLEGTLTSLGSLRSLVSVDLSDNRIVGRLPISIGQLSQLKTLNLAKNRLMGSIPEAIGKMQALQDLDLSQNSFTGTLPAVLGQIPGLRTVSVWHNALQGNFPLAVCRESLEFLIVSFNELSGELPLNMKRCASLSQLMLGHNRFQGNLRPTTLAGLTDLEILDLSANDFGGPLPDSLRQLSKLNTLDISDNKFTGGIADLAQLKLRVLHADRNRLSGPLPDELLIGTLKSLTLAGNQFDGRLPAGLCELSQMRILVLSRNHFKGGLCTNLEQLNELQILDLSHNQLSGEIPASLGDLKRLTTVLLSNNGFSGPLPTEGELPILQVLDLSSNRLSGKLPAWLTHAPLLASVNLRNNAFTGGLIALGKLPFLQRVDLRENAWQEPVPERLAKLQNAPAALLPPAVVQPEELAFTNVGKRQETEVPPRKARQKSIRIGAAVRTQDVAGGSVTGTLYDPMGAVLPGAVVTATCGSGTRTTATNNEGHYQLLLPAGECALRFEFTGFQRQNVTGLKIEPQTSLPVDATLEIGASAEVVEVLAKASDASSGPWWNTWFTRRGVADESGETILQPNRSYYFYLELSGVARRDQEKGEFSAGLAGELRERLANILAEGTVETDLFVRVSVIGRAAVLSDKVRAAAEWSPAGWAAHDGDAGSAVLKVDLARLLHTPAESEPMKWSNPLTRRGGAVRFAIDTRDAGCSVVAVSIWDEDRIVPLDHLIRRISVGRQPNCASELTESHVPPTLYSHAAHDVAPDVSLQVFEFKLNGQTHSASFMTFRRQVQPTKDETEVAKASREAKTCSVYTWDGDGTLTGLVLNNASFQKDLNEARLTDKNDVYSSLGRQLTTAVFPPEGKSRECGAAAALKGLKEQAKKGQVRMFARISDENDRLSIIPLGLLTMFRHGGQRVFAHDIRLIQPVTRETLSPTKCVGDWTFLLPKKLEGLPDVDPPEALSGDERVVTSRENLEERLSEMEPSESPRGLVLLAHHVGGLLRFAGPGDVLPFVEFSQEMAPGSIAVLSACETTNLSGSTKLVEHLNKLNIDAMVAASFVVYPKFGVAFAVNFSSVIAEHEKHRQQLTLEEAFDEALSNTIADISRDTSPERARGMGQEFVLMGNPKLQICAPPASANPPPGH